MSIRKSRKDIDARLAAAQNRLNMRGVAANRLNQSNPRPTRATMRYIRQNRLQRPVRVERTTPAIVEAAVPDGPDLFYTGGIGDVIALESFLTEQEREAVTSIFYATQKYEGCRSLFERLPNYKNLQHQMSVWDDFSSFWCFYSKDDCLARLQDIPGGTPAGLVNAQDWSIMRKFPLIRNGNLSYTNSSFLRYDLADISKFSLPDRYVTICPFSSDKRLEGRDFIWADWLACFECLRILNAKGVLLNVGNDRIPHHDSLINLSNQTTLPESVEILKGGMAYIGIDSALSVLASKLFLYPYCMIKSLNDHCYNNLACYFAPHKQFNFVMRSIIVPPELA